MLQRVGSKLNFVNRIAGRDFGVAMLGARMHYAVPVILHKAGRLEKFYTDSYRNTKIEAVFSAKARHSKFAPKMVKMFASRYSDELSGADIARYERFAIKDAFTRRRLATRSAKQALSLESAKLFGKEVIASGGGHHKYLYAFKGAAAEIFGSANKGCVKILEQSILPSELKLALMEKESRHWGKLYTRSIVHDQYDDAAISRERLEWELADKIVAGSEFVKQGLLKCGVSSNKISVIPYGIPLPTGESTQQKNSQKLELLFAGEVGIRKGVHYLLEALKELNDREVHVTFAGDCYLTDEVKRRYSKAASFLGRVPRGRMAQLYSNADAFVLPSVVEGSATVTYEAIAYGLPVITTPNAGSLVASGVNGYVVPVGDVDALAKAISSYVIDKDLLQRHQDASVAMRDIVSFRSYEKRFRSALID